MLQVSLVEIGSIAKGMFKDSCDLHGITAEHVLKYKIEEEEFF